MSEEEEEDEDYDRILRVLGAVEEEEDQQEQEEEKVDHVPDSYRVVDSIAKIINFSQFLNLYGHSKHGLPLSDVFQLQDPEFHLSH
jgi:hypothetical protein